MPYLLIKSVHVGAVMIFVGGLFSHHSALRVNGPPVDPDEFHFSRTVTTAAMFTVWGAGIWMASSAGWFPFFWLQLKFVFVALLSGIHGAQTGWIRRGKVVDRRIKASLFWLIIISLIAISCLVILKPRFG